MTAGGADVLVLGTQRRIRDPHLVANLMDFSELLLLLRLLVEVRDGRIVFLGRARAGEVRHRTPALVTAGLVVERADRAHRRRRFAYVAREHAAGSRRQDTDLVGLTVRIGERAVGSEQTSNRESSEGFAFHLVISCKGSPTYRTYRPHQLYCNTRAVTENLAETNA